MGNLRTFARRELIFLNLGVMDACVIAPLFAALLAPLMSVQLFSLVGGLLGVIFVVHHLARLLLNLEIPSRLRVGLIGVGMLISGLWGVHQALYASTAFLTPSWLIEIAHGLRQGIPWRAVSLFLAVLFLWWRGLVLAQRRIDSESVAFRFRLGVVLLAFTTGIGSSVLSWPYHQIVFLFFFASLLGIALARAEEVGQQYGGRHSPFGLGWLTALVIASVVVLLLAAGLASVLNGETIGRVFKPIWSVLSVVLFILLFVVAWLAQFLINPLLALFEQYELGRALDEALGDLVPPGAFEPSAHPREPFFTPEQLTVVRTAGVIGGALLIIVLIALTLRRLRAGSHGQFGEERESVWREVDLRRGLDGILRRGRQRLRGATEALRRSQLGQLFAAMTIRRIYAHLGALAEERGYPRALDETPYDYLPTLEKAFPECQEDLARITEAYVAVHYGELPERPEELEAVREAWERLLTRLN